MPYPSVSIHIVTWNSMDFLPDLLRSITQQTYQDMSVLIVDNGSTDGVEGFLRERYPEVTFLRNARNLGFCTAHNQAIRYALEHWGQHEGRFVLVANPDVILEPDFVEQLVVAASAHPDAGSFGGKLLRAFGENLGDDVLREIIKSDRLDSTGLRMSRSRRVTDRGAGELDTGQYDEQKEVFGITGALALYRARALADVRYGDEFFDQDFFAYKEDVDMAWRLQHAGWQARYVPQARAYHYRGMYGPEKIGLWQRLRNRSDQSSLRNYFSTRNHWLMLLKNLRISNAILAAPWLFPAEVGRFLYTMVREKGLRAALETVALLPRIMRKRRYTLRAARVRASDIRVFV